MACTLELKTAVSIRKEQVMEKIITGELCIMHLGNRKLHYTG